MKKITRLALVLACACSTQAAASAQDHPFETDELRKPSFQTGGNCLITNVTVHSAVGPAQLASVLVTSGDIAAIGPDLEAPEGYTVIDGGGGHLTPGVVDCHSHMAIEGGINEGTLSITCDVDISDVINADDLTIFRALAGGTTTARLLHGSANAIGGRHEVIKLRWHKGTEELRFDEAPEGVKFALGENPKRRGGGGGRGGGAGRFPGTRMGVEAVYYRAFSRALEYQAEWKAYRDGARAAGQDPVPVRARRAAGRPGRNPRRHDRRALALLPRRRDPDAAARGGGTSGSGSRRCSTCSRATRSRTRSPSTVPADRPSATGGPTRSRPTMRFPTTPP